MNRFTSRKFLLTMYFAIVATVLVCCKLLTGGEFVEIALVILGVHHASNVADGYFNPPTTQVSGPTWNAADPLPGGTGGHP